MKKLILACCIVLGLGGCLMLGGWAAGGQLYGSYYNGALHPVTESIRDIAHGLQNELHYHAWEDEHGWHSGWFDDDFDSTIDQAVDDALDDIDTDWVDDWLEKRHETIASDVFLPYIGVDTVQNLNFDFSSSSEKHETDTVRIIFASNYDVSGADITKSEMEGQTWALQLCPNGSEDCVITLPSSITDIFSDISLDIGNHRVEIDGSLTAQKIAVDIESGTLVADSLNAGQFDLSIDNGRFAPNRFCVSQQADVELGSGTIASTIVTPGDGSDLGYQVSTDGGVFLLDGQVIAGGDSDNCHASRKGAISGSPILRAEIGSGTLDLLTQ